MTTLVNEFVGNLCFYLKTLAFEILRLVFSFFGIDFFFRHILELRLGYVCSFKKLNELFRVEELEQKPHDNFF